MLTTDRVAIENRFNFTLMLSIIKNDNKKSYTILLSLNLKINAFEFNQKSIR